MQTQYTNPHLIEDIWYTRMAVIPIWSLRLTLTGVFDHYPTHTFHFHPVMNELKSSGAWTNVVCLRQPSPLGA